MIVSTLWRWILLDNSLDAPFILDSVFFEEVVCVGLGGRLGVGIVQKVLDAEENLLDGDCWLPCLLLVQNGEANSSAGVNVRMEKRRCELAY